MFVLGGSTPTGGLEVRKASLFVNLVPKTERALPQKTIKTIISDKLADIPDTRAWYVNERGERELSFSMLSHNGEELNDAVRKLEGALRQVPGFKNVAADASIDRPELRVVPKFDVAARLGVAPSKIAETIRVATIGDIDANLAKFNAGDRLVPIRVQIDEDARTDMQRLQNLRVTNATGVAIPLAAVADVTFGRGPSSISRYDRERRAVIGVDLESRYAMSSAREKFLKVVDEQKLPPSVRLQPSGDAEMQDEVATGFMTAMGTGLMIVFGVLVLLFGSVAQPITILLSLPLSFGGVVLALLATNNSVSMPVYIGLLMLMGIVTKNAIMLVDFAVEEVAQGVPRFDAVIDAGRKRARPIVMTTLAMVAGMVPSAMAHRRWRRVPRADGHRGDRRPAGVDRAVAGLRAVVLHGDGRRRPLHLVDLRPLHRPDRRVAGVPGRDARTRPPRRRRGASATPHSPSEAKPRRREPVSRRIEGVAPQCRSHALGA